MKETVSNERNNHLFNIELKENFLDEMINGKEISKETSRSYERVLSVTSSYEKFLEKDLYQFNLPELEKILSGFKANNRNTVESYARIMSSYLNWCLKEELSNENPLAQLKPDDFGKYLTDDEVYFSNDQLQRYEDSCANLQDAVILRLLFIGVGGRQMSELRNLSKSDIDENNNRIGLRNTLKEDSNGMPIKFTERYLDVDQRTMDMIIGAMKQKTYIKRNGDMESYDNIRPYTDLVLNNYVIRPSITRTDNWEYPTDRFVIYRRIKAISESLDIEDLTSKFIQRSGMIYMASQITKKGEEVSLNDLKMIADRFNISSYHNLKGFINMKNIMKTYNIE